MLPYGLVKTREKFLADLTELGKDYDFNYPDKITINRDNFRGPFHFNQKVAVSIICEEWSGEKGFGKTYKPKKLL